MNVKLHAETRGGHTHVDVFVGPDSDHLALSGRMVFTRDEWSALQHFAAQVAGLIDVFEPPSSGDLVSIDVVEEFPRERRL